MASIPSSLSSLLLLLTLALILISPSPASSTSHRLTKSGLKIGLTNIHSGGSFANFERLLQAVKRSSRRLQKLNGMVLGATQQNLTTTVFAGEGAYNMNFSIGTPAMSYSGIMDTGSDLIWTQCQPCLECFNQSDPLFDPKKSSSFSNESCTGGLCQNLPVNSCNPYYGCVYIYEYGSGITSGFLGTETFTFEKVSVPGIAFGCGLFNLGFEFTEGLIGLGRGPLSLISQLGEPEFSYCLTSYGDNKSSNLLIGSQASVNSTGGGGNNTNISTPLIRNPLAPSFYYLSLEGITVGNTTLPVNKTTFAIKSDGSGGVIIDSGTTITFLELNAYLLVRKAFISQVNLTVVDLFFETGLDLCFKLPSNASSVVIPKLLFHFTDLDLNLPMENYMLGNSSIFLQGLDVTCLAMAGSFGFSIFGNIQQQNYLITYDLSKETLSFTSTECDKF